MLNFKSKNYFHTWFLNEILLLFKTSYFILILIILQRYSEDKKTLFSYEPSTFLQSWQKTIDQSFATSLTIMYLEHGIRDHYCCDYGLKIMNHSDFSTKKTQNNYLLQSALLLIVNKINILFSHITFLTFLKSHYLRMPINL